MSLSEDQINECVTRYERERDRYEKLANIVYAQCLDIVNNKLTVRATVHRRTKDPRSLRNKITKNKDKYKNVDDFFLKISDLAGVRITAYRESDRAKIAAEIESRFEKDPTKDSITEIKDRTEPKRHYRATHCQIILKETHLDGQNENLRNTTCEIQVCSLLAHVFNEVEHDLQYKELNGSLSTTESLLLDQIGLLTKSGDTSIELLLQATEDRHKTANGEFADVFDFIARTRYFSSRFSENSGPLYDILRELNIKTPDDLQQLILGIDKEKKIEEFSNFLKMEQKPNLFEPDTSDELLVCILPKIFDKIISKYPAGPGKGRPPRIGQFAYAYNRMIEYKHDTDDK